VLRERKQTEVVADHFAVQRQGLRERARMGLQPVAQKRGTSPLIELPGHRVEHPVAPAP
jgi:hypothetical protein